jgi:hypothetical protein
LGENQQLKGEMMILKGFISKINIYNNTAEVIFPEYDNVVTSELPFYNRTAHSVEIGEFVLVALFNGGGDFGDGVIL